MDSYRNERTFSSYISAHLMMGTVYLGKRMQDKLRRSFAPQINRFNDAHVLFRQVDPAQMREPFPTLGALAYVVLDEFARRVLDNDGSSDKL